MKRILICDDEPHVVEGLRHLLRDANRTIETACNGREGLRKIAARVPDLLITDVMMPEMNGLELVATLRADPRTRDLPVIILTAKAHAQDAGAGWGAAVIPKPFEPRRVRELVTDLLAKTTCTQPNCT